MTDAHHARPLPESNRTCRCTSNCSSIRKKSSKITFIFVMSKSQILCWLQTLTTLYIQWNQIKAEGAQAISQALKSNQVRSIFCFFRSIIYYRRWPHSISVLIKSASKADKQSVKHYKQIKWNTISIFSIAINHRLQTLTTVSLLWNQIRDEGVRAICQALERNQVRDIFSFLMFKNDVLCW